MIEFLVGGSLVFASCAVGAFFSLASWKLYKGEIRFGE